MLQRQACHCNDENNSRCECQHYANAVIDQRTGQALEYRHFIQQQKTKECWLNSFTNEIGLLEKGVNNDGKGMNTIEFIAHPNIPKDR